MRKAFLQLHIAIFLAGFTAILGKLILLQEGWLVWYRLLFTVSILALMLLKRRELYLLPVRDMIRIFMIGLVVAIHWLTFYGSIKYSNASIALVCLAANGFFTALLEPFLVNRRISIAELLLGLLGLAGIYVIFDFHPQYFMGIAFGLVSALGSSIFPILNKQMLKKYSPRSITFYELTGAWIGLSLLLPFYHRWFPANGWLPSLSDGFWLLILSVLCTIIAFDLQLKALRKVSAFTSNLSYNLEPVYGILLAFWILKEGNYLHTGFYWGLLMVASAVGLQMLREFYLLRKRQIGAEDT